MRNDLTMKNFVPRQPVLADHHAEHMQIRALEAEYFRGHSHQQNQYVEIIWLTRGSCQLVFDLKTYDVLSGMVLISEPGQRFNIQSMRDLDGFVIRFPIEVLPLDFESTYLNTATWFSRIFEIDKLTGAGMMSVIQCMQRELTNAHCQKNEILSGYLRIVLIYLSKQRSVSFKSGFDSDTLPLARKFFDLLESRYQVSKKVSDYADELAVTPNYLNKIIKRETGLSASANIRKRLVMQAKRMAQAQGVSLKAIAYELGFGDVAHFSKYFKVTCGCNFTTYLKTRPR